MTTATAAELEAVWAERVRHNRDQVDLIREVPDRDFYAPVSSLFVADPRRTGEEALDALLALAAPTDRWLDIGAGAGRYALPLAIEVAEVIAVEPSASMRNALRTGKSEHGARQPPDRRRRLAGRARRSRRPAGRGRRVHRPRRLRHRGDRAVPRRDGHGRVPDVRRDADGPQPGVGGGPVLAGSPRHGADPAARLAGAGRAAPRPRPRRPRSSGSSGRRGPSIRSTAWRRSSAASSGSRTMARRSSGSARRSVAWPARPMTTAGPWRRRRSARSAS